MILQDRLLQWFGKNARPLPWRKHYRPYEVWISEIMLQQTQVETVLPYYVRWMRLFPDIQTLAASDQKKVLKAWQGLGYYSRARSLHENAKLIVEKFEGEFPRDFESILSLKGIGRYTAGAISSIAFNKNTPIVDGNIFRVLSRIYAIDKPIDVESNKEAFWKLQEKLIPKGKARYFNQALMELGALVCTSKSPACLACPVNKFCKAFKQNKAESYPVRANKKVIVKVEAGAVVFSQKGRFLIHQRPTGELMGGLWEFPEWKLAQGKALTPQEVRTHTLRRAREDFGKSIENLRYLDTIKRNYTRYNESLRVFLSELDGGRTPKAAGTKNWPSVWASKADFQKYPFSSAHAKIVNLL